MASRAQLTPLRTAVLAAAVVVALVDAAGLGAHLAFDQFSLLKYVISIAAPLLIAALTFVPRPVEAMVAVLIFAIPFAGFNAKFSVHIPLLLPLALLATITAILDSAPPSASKGRLVKASPLIVGALLLTMVLGKTSIDDVTVLASVVLFAWLTARATAAPSGMRLAVAALTLSAALQELIALYEYKTGHRLNLYSSPGKQAYGSHYFFGFDRQQRATGAFYDPISLGNFLALSLPIITAAAIQARRPLFRVLALAAAVLTSLGLVVTLSRMSWIGAAVGVIAVVVLSPPGRRARAVLVTGGLAVALAASAVAVAGPALVSRFDTIANPTSTQSSKTNNQGDLDRLHIWTAAIDTFKAHPLTGVGFSGVQGQLDNRLRNAGPDVHSHSTYLQFLAAGGIVGGAALVLFLLTLIADAFTARRRPYMAGALGATLALLVIWSSDFVLRYSGVAATVAVVIGLVCGQLAGDRVREAVHAGRDRRARGLTLVPSG